MNMNTRLGSQEISLVNSVLLASGILLLCALGALAYGLFGGSQSSRLGRPATNSFETGQLEANTRTFFAGVRYLLEPEPPISEPGSASTASLGVLPFASCAQSSFGLACASNCCRRSPTNPPHSG